MSTLFARIAADGPPLRGIVHAAADLSSAAIRDLTPALVDAMLRPKLDGTIILEKLSRTVPLDFLVLFSSTTALLGAAGLAHYAGANAFLDAFAAAVDAPGRRVLSINWGTWEVMRLASADSQRSYRASGLEPMPVDAALAELGAALASPQSQAIVARIDWGVLKPLHELRRARPLLAKLEAPAPATAASAAQLTTMLVDELAGLPAADRRERILRFVSAEVAAVLGRDPAEPIPPAVGLFELGMDSLMSVELRRRLERGVGQPLPSTLTFNYPNVDALTGFLVEELGRAQAAENMESIEFGAQSEEQASVTEDLGSLSDEQLEARLLQKLESIK